MENSERISEVAETSGKNKYSQALMGIVAAAAMSMSQWAQWIPLSINDLDADETITWRFEANWLWLAQNGGTFTSFVFKSQATGKLYTWEAFLRPSNDFASNTGDLTYYVMWNNGEKIPFILDFSDVKFINKNTIQFTTPDNKYLTGANFSGGEFNISTVNNSVKFINGMSAPIPEPETYALIWLWLWALGIATRGRKKTPGTAEGADESSTPTA